MPNKLFLKPIISTQLASEHLSYESALFDVSGARLRYSQCNSLEEIDQDLMQNGIEGVDVLVLWPANHALRSNVFLPSSQARYAQQALPFAVEEQLAQDVEYVHIALGEKTDVKNNFLVACIDRAVFGLIYHDVSSFCSSYNFKGIYLESDALEKNADDLTLSLGSKTNQTPILVTNHQEAALRISEENLMPYIDALLSGGEDEETVDDKIGAKVIVNASDLESYRLNLAELEQVEGLSLEVNEVDLNQFEVLCHSFLQQKKVPISLCQGDFKLVSESSQSWRKWRAVAIIAGLGFFLQCGVFIGKGVYYQQQAEVIEAKAIEEYQKASSSKRQPSIDKLARIIKGRLNQQSQQGEQEVDFLNLIGEAGYQYSQSPNKSSMMFKTISFNKQRGELILEMQAINFSQLEELKQAIVSTGLQAKIGSSVQEEKFFRGRISVSGS